MNLTDEEIRIKVHESLGWAKRMEGPIHYAWSRGDSWHYLHGVPNYPLDLNACVEFEKTLTEQEHRRFRMHLWDIVITLGGEDSWDQNIVSANAKTRCLAYLKTKGIIQ